MYMNCGDEATARDMFETCPNKDVISWNAMIASYIEQNRTDEAVLLFSRQAGLTEKGIDIIHSMHEAWEFINSMPVEPDASVLRALLSACRLRANTKLAAVIFEKFVGLEPANVGNYVPLSNIYAAAGLWSEVRLIRTLLKEKGMRKSPGISWIIIRGQIHSFASGDKSHPGYEKIYTNLSSLMALVRECGSAIDVHLLFHDEEDGLDCNSPPEKLMLLLDSSA